jgi:hypothetical protein
MTNQTWRVVAAALAVILAVLGGATIAFVIAPGPGASPSPVLPGFPTGSPSGSDIAGASASLPVSPPPSESLAPSASAPPTPSPTPVPIAQVTITELKLDPRMPSNAGDPRFISFTSDGPGTITAQLKAISPQGTTHMCLRAGSKDIKCGDSANGTITATTTSARVNWRVSLQGNGMFTPTVELTVTFPAVAPSIKITHARFDGTSFPDTNGVQAIFVPRAAGNAKIVASWGGHPFTYEIDAINQSSGSGNKTLTNQGPSTNTNKSIAVTAGETWKVLLENADAGFGITDMTYSLSWP